MGYTHYWRKPSEDKYRKAFKIAQKIASRGVLEGVLVGWDGTGEAEITDEVIRFNGRDEEGHETFVLPSEISELRDFNFCKTARKPYDKYVVAILYVMSDVIAVSSDGDMEGDEWQEGIDLALEYQEEIYAL